MPVTLETCENGHVQFYVFSDPWRVEDFIALYPADTAHRNNVDFRVHTLADVSLITRVPPGVLGVRQGLPALEHPRHGELVVVGATNYVRVMAELILRMAHYTTAHFVNTLDEGWAYLREWMTNNPD